MTIIAMLPQRYHNRNYNSRDNDNNGANKTPLSDDTNNADNYNHYKDGGDDEKTGQYQRRQYRRYSIDDRDNKKQQPTQTTNLLFKICKLFGATTHSYICNVSVELVTTGLSQVGEMRSRKAMRNKNTFKSNSK